MVAGAVHGIENELALEPEFTGNAYDDETAGHMPTTLREALGEWRTSDVARTAFGDDVVAHYANMATCRAGRVRRRGDGLGAVPWL